uniref:Response regulatory domain-containing protein n=1 Tax=Thermosporothrix sp. COM3 TaxID=2490863 RepID=A0A455ST16_9CHLR|nr:hypothetical protein KTC_55170 [Thermosporothrix sp. COM3]
MNNTPEKQRILIVEDEDAIQQVFSFFLEHNGFETHSVFNGQDAIAAIPVYKPHLIILDLVMRPVSGWDVLHWLREHQQTIPVLVSSALVHLTEQVQGFEEGAIEYITKPAQPSVIVERVRTLLSLNHEQRLMLQHQRIDERKRTLERIQTAQQNELPH